MVCLSRTVPATPPSPVEPSAPMKQAKHVLEELGDGLSPIGHAKAILEHAGKLTVHHGRPWLDNAYATPRAIMLAANRILKANDLPQIGGLSSEWRV